MEAVEHINTFQEFFEKRYKAKLLESVKTGKKFLVVSFLDLSRFNPEIANIFILFHILIGILLFSSGIMILYLSDYIIKRKEKMTWIILFIIGITNWVTLLIISLILGNILLIILTAIGWLTFIFGMLLPIKYYLEKSYREY